MKNKIIFESDDFIVADKPCGVLTVPSRYEKNDSRNILGRQLEDELKIKLYPVHRLDYEVSGLVIFAKKSQAQRQISSLFEKRRVKKTYHAVATGKQSFAHWPTNLPRVEAPILPGQVVLWKSIISEGKKRSFVSDYGFASETLVQLFKTNDDHSFWILQPHSGRRHQLRLEMSRHGYPIAGDVLYGASQVWPEGIALRAVEIEFLDEIAGLDRILKIEGLWV
jgi:tRNA pseudouridine32 synthase / 23S rRNA pseudouridine746 synthase